jgi:hypothetical protein
LIEVDHQRMISMISQFPRKVDFVDQTLKINHLDEIFLLEKVETVAVVLNRHEVRADRKELITCCNRWLSRSSEGMCTGVSETTTSAKNVVRVESFSNHRMNDRGFIGHG